MITAPVTIADVKQTLNATSNDLGTLCKSQNINVWSRCKPVMNSSMTATSCPVLEDGSAKAELLDDWIKVACGMTVPIATETNMRNQVSGSGERGSMFEFVTKFFGSSKITGNTYDPYVSVATLDKIRLPYRLVDFNNYDPNAASFFNFATDKDSTPELSSSSGTYDVRCFLRMAEDSSTLLKPEDLLGELASLSGWKLRIEVFYIPTYTKEYYDIDLVDSTTNRTYANSIIQLARYPRFPEQMSFYCNLTAYFYHASTDEAIVFPPAISTRTFTLNKSHRNINIKGYYNGTGWYDMSVIPASLYSNQIRITADVEKTSMINIGENYEGRIRCNVQLASGGATTTVVGFACDLNGTNVNKWQIPSSSTSGDYLTIYMLFPAIVLSSHSRGDYANITFEFSSDSGNSWIIIGGFAATLYFN